MAGLTMETSGLEPDHSDRNVYHQQFFPIPAWPHVVSSPYISHVPLSHWCCLAYLISIFCKCVPLSLVCISNSTTVDHLLPWCSLKSNATHEMNADEIPSLFSRCTGFGSAGCFLSVQRRARACVSQYRTHACPSIYVESGM
jgi:hypothetical protein